MQWEQKRCLRQRTCTVKELDANQSLEDDTPWTSYTVCLEYNHSLQLCVYAQQTIKV